MTSFFTRPWSGTRGTFASRNFTRLPSWFPAMILTSCGTPIRYLFTHLEMKLIHVEVVPHHKVHPLQYATDCEAILGYMLPHDDSVNDRSEGSKLNNAHEITVKLWKNAFSHSFAKPGAMYRGDPPNGKLWPLKQEHLTQMLSSSRFNVRITKLEIRFTFAFITCN